jgi:uncharacterized protein with HEPN domain
MRRDAQRLADIAEAADIVADYLQRVGRQDFFAGGLVHDAILRQMMIAGEAAYKVSGEVKARHPEVPWAQIAGFRHRVVHDYFGLDLDAVWQFATAELPLLRNQAMAIIAVEFS